MTPMPTNILAQLETWTSLPPHDGEVQAACPHDCPDTCAMRVRVENGRVVTVKGDPTHALTAGTLCTKVSRYAERTYHPDRLKTPLKRIGQKGEGKFVPISWDEAYALIAERLAEIWRRNPEAVLPYSYAGTMGQVQGEGMAGRLFHALGASRLEHTICSAAGGEGLRLSMGKNIGMDPEAISGAKLIVLWGSNPISSHVHLWAQIQQAKRDGAVLWAIDPYRSDSAEKCQHHIALRPGTDTALAYAIAHVLQRDGHLDHDYLARYTTGADAFLQRAAEWSPARAAAWCDIDPAQIEALALAYATTHPAAIRLNYGVQRHAGGGDAVRAIMALPALAGHWRESSGGAVLSTSGWFPKRAAVTRPDLLGDRAPRWINMSTIGDALNATGSDRIEALVVYNSNPLAVAPDSNAVRRGFSRDDLFTVVLEHFQTDTADYADILLPATTQLEHFDLHGAYGHLHVLLNRPAIAPLYEARSNSRIFRELAARLALTLGDDCPALRDPALAASDAQIASEAFDWNHPAFGGEMLPRLFAQGHSKLHVPAATFAAFAQGGFATNDGRFQFTRAELDQPLPQVRDNHEDWKSPRAQAYPLQLISPPPRHLLNSSFANIQSLRALAGDSHEPIVVLNPVDAAAKKVGAGDTARIFNERGSFLARVRVNKRARPGVAVAFSIFWHKDTLDGNNCNAVTSQALSDHGGSATFYDCLVQVESVASVPI
jgi:anaerobic selenocysteine-containing dehydrogenase